MNDLKEYLNNNKADPSYDLSDEDIANKMGRKPIKAKNKISSEYIVIGIGVLIILIGILILVLG